MRFGSPLSIVLIGRLPCGAYEAATLYAVRCGVRSGRLFLPCADEYRGKERLRATARRGLSSIRWTAVIHRWKGRGVPSTPRSTRSEGRFSMRKEGASRGSR